MNVADPNAIDDGSPLEYYTPKPKRPWPTLEGRLSQPLTSRGEALRQMKDNGDILTPLAEKYLKKYEDARKRRSKRIRKGAK
jgi:hypothetical protein